MKLKIIRTENRFLTHDIINEENGKKTMLPHGSGIDGKWHIEDKGDRYVCYNIYNCMNDAGLYDGWVDFSVTIHKQTGDTKVRFHTDSYGWRRVYKYMLREYLDDLFAMTIQELD